MGGGDDGGHGLVDGEEGGVGDGDLDHLVGVQLYVVDDEVDFGEKIGEVADHLLGVGAEAGHNVGSYNNSKNYLSLETIS